MKKLFALIAMVLPMMAFAQGQKENIVLPQTEATFQLAAQLSSYGYAQNDPVALISAARIAKQHGYVQEPSDKTTEGKATSTDKKKTSFNLNPETLLADAKNMARGNSVLLDMIEDVAKNKRGAVGGPKYKSDCVRGNATDIYRVNFRGGELATVAVVGDGDTDLDLYIYDENGNLIDYDSDYTDRCVCSFYPRWTGYFSIKIVNRGAITNCYVIRTN